MPSERPAARHQARRDARDVSEVQHEDAARGEHGERQRDFGDDERARQAAAARAGCCANAFAERVGGSCPHGLPQWRETRERAGHDGRAEREQQHAPIDRDLVGARQER